MTTTTIGRQTQIKGRLEGDSPVDLHGQLQGEIDLRDTLTIFEEGRVEGRLLVDNLVVFGELYGEVEVRNHLVLKSGSRVVANVVTHHLQMEEGAIIKGAIESHVGNPDSAKSLTQGSGGSSRSSRSSASRSSYNTTRSSRPAQQPAKSSSAKQEEPRRFVRPNPMKQEAASTPKRAPEKVDDSMDEVLEVTPSGVAAKIMGSDSVSTTTTTTTVVFQGPIEAPIEDTFAREMERETSSKKSTQNLDESQSQEESVEVRDDEATKRIETLDESEVDKLPEPESSEELGEEETSPDDLDAKLTDDDQDDEQETQDDQDDSNTSDDEGSSGRRGKKRRRRGKR